MKPIIPLLIAACFMAACIPIPVKHQEQVTPDAVGRLTLENGAPASQYFIAATDDDKDRTCSKQGGHGVSDSVGHFELPETSVQRKIFWLTMMENFGMRRYWLCVRPAASGAPSDARVEALSRTFVFGDFRGDSLDCLRWSWRDTTRLSCNAEPTHEPMLAHHYKQILRGGSWADGDLSGSYRVLFVVQDGTWASTGRAVVQWIGRAPGTLNTVRAQADLPTRDSVWALNASLDHVGDAWQVRVKSARRTTWGNDIWLTYTLGAPGSIHEVKKD